MRSLKSAGGFSTTNVLIGFGALVLAWLGFRYQQAISAQLSNVQSQLSSVQSSQSTGAGSNGQTSGAATTTDLSTLPSLMPSGAATTNGANANPGSPNSPAATTTAQSAASGKAQNSLYLNSMPSISMWPVTHQ